MSRATQARRVLEILADGGWHTTLEFVDAGILRAAARVHELRRAGRPIETRRRGSYFDYRLGTSPSTSSPTGHTAPIWPEDRPCFIDGCLDAIAGTYAGQWFCRRHLEEQTG